MNPLLALVGPIITGLMSLKSDPKAFVKEVKETPKSTITGLAGIGATIVLAQTQEEAILAIIVGLLSLASILYKK